MINLSLTREQFRCLLGSSIGGISSVKPSNPDYSKYQEFKRFLLDTYVKEFS